MGDGPPGTVSLEGRSRHGAGPFGTGAALVGYPVVIAALNTMLPHGSERIVGDFEMVGLSVTLILLGFLLARFFR